MSLRNNCHSPMITIAPTATVREACLTMVGAGLGAIAIVDGEKLIGIFTERDAVQKVVLNAIDPTKTSISEVMSSPVITIPQDRSPHDALTLLKRNGIRHLVVVDNDTEKQIVGLISYRLLLSDTIENLNAEVDSLTAYMGNDGIGGD